MYLGTLVPALHRINTPSPACKTLAQSQALSWSSSKSLHKHPYMHVVAEALLGRSIQEYNHGSAGYRLLLSAQQSYTLLQQVFLPFFSTQMLYRAANSLLLRSQRTRYRQTCKILLQGEEKAAKVVLNFTQLLAESTIIQGQHLLYLHVNSPTNSA